MYLSIDGNDDGQRVGVPNEFIVVEQENSALFGVKIFIVRVPKTNYSRSSLVSRFHSYYAMKTRVMWVSDVWENGLNDSTVNGARAGSCKF